MYHITFLIILATVISVSTIETKKFNNLVAVTADTTLCFKVFFEKYYLSFHQMVDGSSSVLLFSTLSKEIDLQNNLLNIFNNQLNTKYSLIINEIQSNETNILSENYYNIKNYILLIDNYLDIEIVLKKWIIMRSWNSKANVFVILTNASLNIANEINLSTKYVTNYLYKYYVFNFSVLTYDKNKNAFNVVTWFPYQNKNCANNITDLTIICECNNTEINFYNQIDSQNYFNMTKIPKLLNNCPLNISSGMWSPYVYYKSDVFNMKEQQLNGIEISILETIADTLQIDLKYNFLNDTIHNYSNDNILYVYSDLLLRKSDLVIGGLDSYFLYYLNNTLLTTTIAYSQDDISWCVPISKPKPLMWLSVEVFTVDMWFIIWSPLIMGWITIYFLIRMDYLNHDCYWAMIVSFGTLTGGYSLYKPKRILSRFFFSFFLLTGFWFASIFCCLWLHTLTKPTFREQVDTVEYAISYDYTFAIGKNVFQHLNDIYKNHHLLWQKLMHCDDIDKCLIQLEYADLLAVGISRKHAWNNLNISNSKLFCFENKLYNYPIIMLTRKDFPLLQNINNLIRRFIETGIIDKWERENEINPFDDALKQRKGHYKNIVPIILQMDRFWGVYVFLGGMWIISAVILISERVYFEIVRRSTKPNRFIVIMERVLNPTYILYYAKKKKPNNV